MSSTATYCLKSLAGAGLALVMVLPSLALAGPSIQIITNPSATATSQGSPYLPRDRDMRSGFID